ncbi:MAG: hypothetical protein ACKOBT_04815, partial [Actinomycetota bacterium]
MTTYAGNRSVIDIDSHILEPIGWLRNYAASAVRDEIPELGANDPEFSRLLREAELAHRHRADDSEAMQRAVDDYMTMARKGWMSLGGWDPAERSIALDRLGFSHQVVFPTGSFTQVYEAPVFIRAEAARAMNRGIRDFCSDPRLLATAYVPFEHGPDVALGFVEDAARQ